MAAPEILIFFLLNHFFGAKPLQARGEAASDQFNTNTRNKYPPPLNFNLFQSNDVTQILHNYIRLKFTNMRRFPWK